jgi:hypothetical protein
MLVVGCVVSTSKRGPMPALLAGAGAGAALATLALGALVGAPNRFLVSENGFAGGGT